MSARRRGRVKEREGGGVRERFKRRKREGERVSEG